MTKFPISATLVIKGLLRPAMLMTYVKVNSFFYGERHVSSGLYFIIKQVDDIAGSGYRTTLSLVRFAGDEDAITTEMEERKYIIAKPKVTQIESNKGGIKDVVRIDKEVVVNDPYKNDPNYSAWDKGYINKTDGTYVVPTTTTYDIMIGKDGKEL